MSRWVDLEAIRDEIQRGLKRDMNDTLGADTDGVLGWLKSKANELGEYAIDENVDLSWVRDILTHNGRFRQQITHAFFESPGRFVIRLGVLGEEPIHVQMTLRRGVWKITGIYK